MRCKNEAKQCKRSFESTFFELELAPSTVASRNYHLPEKLLEVPSTINVQYIGMRKMRNIGFRWPEKRGFPLCGSNIKKKKKKKKKKKTFCFLQIFSWKFISQRPWRHNFTNGESHLRFTFENSQCTKTNSVAYVAVTNTCFYVWDNKYIENGPDQFFNLSFLGLKRK